MNISPRNSTKNNLDSDKKMIELTPTEVERIIDLGFRMKMILMQPDSLKLAE